MALTVQETKEIVTGVVAKLKKSIEREVTYKKELDDDKAVLTYVQNLVDTGETLPPESAYESFNEWIDSIKKEIKAGETSLKRIDTEKAEIKAFEYFIQNAQNEEV